MLHGKDVDERRISALVTSELRLAASVRGGGSTTTCSGHHDGPPSKLQDIGRVLGKARLHTDGKAATRDAVVEHPARGIAERNSELDSLGAVANDAIKVMGFH